MKQHVYDFKKPYTYEDTLAIWIPTACGSGRSVSVARAIRENETAKSKKSFITCYHCKKKAIQ